MQHKIFCVHEFIKTESATAVQRAFRLRFNIHPPTRKNICRWNHQFEQIFCLCKGKSSGRPRVSEENVRWIQESFDRSPREPTGRASRELGILQPTVWCVLRRPLLFKPYRLQLVQTLRPNDKRNWVHLFESRCITSLSFQNSFKVLTLSSIFYSHPYWFLIFISPSSLLHIMNWPSRVISKALEISGHRNCFGHTTSRLPEKYNWWWNNVAVFAKMAFKSTKISEKEWIWSCASNDLCAPTDVTSQTWSVQKCIL